MPGQTPIYDLVLLLSTSAPEERRGKVMSDVEAAISSGGGEIVRRDDWGTRTLAYRIGHQADAEYHLLQLTGPPALLDSLSQSLKITDGVLRFRIIKDITQSPEEQAVVGAGAASQS